MSVVINRGYKSMLVTLNTNEPSFRRLRIRRYRSLIKKYPEMMEALHYSPALDSTKNLAGAKNLTSVKNSDNIEDLDITLKLKKNHFNELEIMSGLPKQIKRLTLFIYIKEKKKSIFDLFRPTYKSYLQSQDEITDKVYNNLVDAIKGWKKDFFTKCVQGCKEEIQAQKKANQIYKARIIAEKAAKKQRKSDEKAYFKKMAQEQKNKRKELKALFKAKFKELDNSESSWFLNQFNKLKHSVRSWFFN